MVLLKTGRIFHIWDLPKDLIWIDLEDDFRKELIDKAKEVAGGEIKLAQYLKVKKHNIFNWRRGRSYWKNVVTRRLVPLKYILILCSLINDSKFSRLELEKNILAFNGPGNGRLIKNKFPWKEDERIIRILFHLLGDGFASDFGKYNEKGKNNGLPYYRNTKKELLEEFKNDLSFFGEVPTNLNIDMLQFPKVISYVLKYLYEVEFTTYTGSVPKIVFNLPKEIVAQGIKAFADDEGSVDDSRIRIFSFNKKMLSQIRLLMISKFPEIGIINLGDIVSYTTNLENKKYKSYKFSINSGGLGEYYKQIGFSHKRKKNLLENWIKRKNRGWNRRAKNITKLLILKSLINEPKTSIEISCEVNVSATSVMAHMQGNSNGIKSLAKAKLVKNIGLTIHHGKIWAITNEGLNYFNKESLRDI